MLSSNYTLDGGPDEEILKRLYADEGTQTPMEKLVPFAYEQQAINPMASIMLGFDVRNPIARSAFVGPAPFMETAQGLPIIDTTDIEGNPIQMFDVQTIGQNMGMTPEQIDKALSFPNMETIRKEYQTQKTQAAKNYISSLSSSDKYDGWDINTPSVNSLLNPSGRDTFESNPIQPELNKIERKYNSINLNRARMASKHPERMILRALAAIPVTTKFGIAKDISKKKIGEDVASLIAIGKEGPTPLNKRGGLTPKELHDLERKYRRDIRRGRRQENKWENIFNTAIEALPGTVMGFAAGMVNPLLGAAIGQAFTLPRQIQEGANLSDIAKSVGISGALAYAGQGLGKLLGMGGTAANQMTTLQSPTLRAAGIEATGTPYLGGTPMVAGIAGQTATKGVKGGGFLNIMNDQGELMTTVVSPTGEIFKAPTKEVLALMSPQEVSAFTPYVSGFGVGLGTGVSGAQSLGQKVGNIASSPYVAAGKKAIGLARGAMEQGTAQTQAAAAGHAAVGEQAQINPEPFYQSIAANQAAISGLLGQRAQFENQLEDDLIGQGTLGQGIF